ncbi:M23 family metallopeptidase [Symbioplanes lichenis]|uniref:M23 family metallopeptidase n=1 Tax=Symbioplanes lichenis TaxID=1629072 RepID=UPI00273A041C|nr:peptidoglycan DD-metalloendopeptidase family protein [Actinoplanes lichenis]
MLLLRKLSVVTVAALSLAACGGQGDGSSATATPQFVVPSETSAATPAPSETPAATTPAPSSPEPAATSAKATEKPESVNYTFPVKSDNVDWHETHSKYKATDIFADCGEPVVATTSGVVLEITTKDAYVKGQPDGPLNGGLAVSLLGDDGVRYYGSHLSKIQSGIEAGVRVTSGQLLGKVGHTGNANGVCHLHYGISPPCAKTGDWKVRRGVVWPYSYLESWRKGGEKSPVATVKSWEKSHDCKA